MSLAPARLFLIAFAALSIIFPVPYRYGCGGGPGPLDELSLCKGWKLFGIFHVFNDPYSFESQGGYLMFILICSVLLSITATLIYKKFLHIKK